MSSSELESLISPQDPDAARAEPEPFRMEELEQAAPPGPQEEPLEEKDGFRLLVVGGRQEDPRERAEREAAQILQDAQARLEEAQAQVESIRNQAYQEGYQKGQEEGREAVRARMEAAAQDLARSLESLDQARARILAAMEGEIVALVQTVCERCFLTPRAVSPESVRQVVSQAVARLGEAERVEVRLSAADLEVVKEFKPQLEEMIEGLKRLVIVSDPELAPGDCLVSSATAMVDATLETRRRRILEALEETFRQGPPLDLSPALAEAPGDPEPADTPDEMEDW